MSLFIDVPSLFVDGAATVFPGIPGGIGTLKTPRRIARGARLVDKAKDAINIGTKLDNPMKNALRKEARIFLAENSDNFRKAVNVGKNWKYTILYL